MNRFDGKIVVITGGGSGIGLAAAQQFESEGARVVVTGRDAATLDAAAKSLGKQVLTVQADVTKTSDLDNLFNTIHEKYGKIDVFTAQKAIPLLNDGGAVIFTSSYFDEFGPRKVRVNAVSPGVIATPLFGKLGVPKEVVEEIGKTLQEKIPFKRFGYPEEIEKAVAFLASSDASYISEANS